LSKNPVSNRPRLKAKETGFLTESAGFNEVFLSKTRFLSTRALQPKKPGFLLNLRVLTKYFCKNPVSEHPRLKTKETGFFTESEGCNQVFLQKPGF